MLEGKLSVHFFYCRQDPRGRHQMLSSFSHNFRDVITALIIREQNPWGWIDVGLPSRLPGTKSTDNRLERFLPKALASSADSART